MRFTEIISESAGTRLKDIAKIATNMQDADFWLVRKGSDKTVGKPVKEFDPSRIGIKVVKTDVLDPNYLYYAMMNLHNQGHFARIANGTTNLVNITVADIANIPLGQQDVAEAGITGSRRSADSISKQKEWQSSLASDSKQDVKTFSYQGYTINFTPNKLNIYLGGDLVLSRKGNFADPTKKQLVAARLSIGKIIDNKRREALVHSVIQKNKGIQGVEEATGDPKFDTMMNRMATEPKYPDKNVLPTSIPELIQWAEKNNKPDHWQFAQWAKRNKFTNVNDALEWFGDNVDPTNQWGPKEDPDSPWDGEWLEDAAKHDPKAAELMKIFNVYERIVFDWSDDYRQMNMPDPFKDKDLDEGEVIPMQPRNPLNKNLIIQLKALSETALEIFWEGSHVPTAAQGQMAELSQQEQNNMFKKNGAQLKALGYEDSIFEDDMDILFLHSIAREAWYDSGKPMSKYRGLPDLEYNSETNSLKIIDLIGDDDKGIVYDKNVYEQGIDEGENWSKHNNKRVGGMSKKSVSSYRRSHPGSKIQTAVTTKPSKLKKGSKAAKRRKSFCARMKGMKKSRTSAKTARDPNSNINKSLRRWNCESIEQMEELLMLAEQMVAKARKEIL